MSPMGGHDKWQGAYITLGPSTGSPGDTITITFERAGSDPTAEMESVQCPDGTDIPFSVTGPTTATFVIPDGLSGTEIVRAGENTGAGLFAPLTVS